MTAPSYPLYQQPDHKPRCYLFSCIYMMSMAAGWPSHAYKDPCCLLFNVVHWLSENLDCGRWCRGLFMCYLFACLAIFFFSSSLGYLSFGGGIFITIIMDLCFRSNHRNK